MSKRKADEISETTGSDLPTQVSTRPRTETTEPMTTEQPSSSSSSTPPARPEGYVPFEDTDFRMNPIEFRPTRDTGGIFSNRGFGGGGGGGGGGGRRKKRSMQVHPRVQRYMYRIRVKRSVSKAQRERMKEMGRKWGPVLARARGIAKANNRGRITSRDYAQARREMNM
jgi:hypothetical protein